MVSSVGSFLFSSMIDRLQIFSKNKLTFPVFFAYDIHIYIFIFIIIEYSFESDTTHIYIYIPIPIIINILYQFWHNNYIKIL